MTTVKEGKNWNQYYHNSRRDVGAGFGNAEKVSEKELFADAQTFDELFEALRLTFEVGKDSERREIFEKTKKVLEDIRHGKSDSNSEKLLQKLDLKEVVDRLLLVEARKKYQENLRELLETFEILSKAKDFKDVFSFLENVDEKNVKKKLRKLDEEFSLLEIRCGAKGKEDPEKKRAVSPEIRKVSEISLALLKKFKFQAGQVVEKAWNENQKKEVEENLNPKRIGESLIDGESIKVKVETKPGKFEKDWLITGIENGEVVVSSPEGVSPKLTKKVDLEKLKKWNIETLRIKTTKPKNINQAEIEEQTEKVGEMKIGLKEKMTKEKEQETKKKESFEGKKKKFEENGEKKNESVIASELEARHDEIVKKIEELEICRREYLETDYDKTSALVKVRKFFSNTYGKLTQKGGISEDEEIRTASKNDPEILAAKKLYDDKLFELQTLILEDARAQNFSDEELTKLHAQFRVEQRITLADEHDKIKAEKMSQNVPGKIGQGMVNMAKWYQGLSWKTKVGIGLAFFAGGAAVAATAGTLFAGAVVGRRIFGGLVAGVGATTALEGRGKKKDQEKIEAEQQKVMAELAKMEAEEKYRFLSDRLNDIIEKDGQSALNKIKWQDRRQQLAGLGVGVFLASGMAGELIKAGHDKIADYFKWNSAYPVKTDGVDKAIDAKPVPGMPGDTSHAPVVDTKGTAGNATAQQVASPDKVSGNLLAGETIKIEKGSSIEKTLIEHIKANHSGKIKDPGWAAHRMWTDYMHDNKDAIVAKVGQVEYDKMLKDGMVNVKPGTVLTFDDHDPLKLTLKDVSYGNVSNEISHLHAYDHHVPGHAPSASLDKTPDVSTTESSESAVGNISDLANPEITENRQIFSQAKEKFLAADSELRGIENWKTDVGDLEATQLEFEKARALEAMRQSAEHIQNTAEFRATQRKLAQEALKTVAGNRADGEGFMREFGNRPVRDLFKDEEYGARIGELRESFRKQGMNFGKNRFKYENNETVKHWMARIVAKAAEKKYEIDEF